MNIFEILKDVLHDKTGTLHKKPDFEKEFNTYMITRYLSMRKDLIEYSHILNAYGTVLSKENQYRLLTNIIPVKEHFFISYIKAEKAPKEVKEAKVKKPRKKAGVKSPAAPNCA